MRSSVLGKSTSRVEIQNISQRGIWLLAYGHEYFLSFKDYPWFKEATIADLHNVKLLHRSHLYWPALDVDLDLESLKHPENYPLVAKGT